MEWSSISSFTIFALVAAFSPGPNNIMLAASGANFGFRSTLPHITGICIGFCLLVFAAGYGISGLFIEFPKIYSLLKVISVIFLIYLAWKIGSAGQSSKREHNRPLRFWQAALFQLVNPKVISVIISSVTTYTGDAKVLSQSIVTLVLIFAIVTLGATCTWTAFGVSIRNILSKKKLLRSFNVLMAILLLISLIPVTIL